VSSDSAPAPAANLGGALGCVWTPGPRRGSRTRSGESMASSPSTAMAAPVSSSRPRGRPAAPPRSRARPDAGGGALPLRARYQPARVSLALAGRDVRRLPAGRVPQLGQIAPQTASSLPSPSISISGPRTGREAKGGAGKLEFEEQAFGAIGEASACKSTPSTRHSVSNDIHMGGGASRLTIESS
jgi:hypothetical protein